MIELPRSTAAFATTRPHGLKREQLPMRLWRKSKRAGVWNPDDIDFSRDREDWTRLQEEERDLLVRLTSLFVAGEESVTLDLLPLIQTIAREGRIEEEMFLAAFLFEEAKHVDFFRRFLDEVAEETGDLSRYHSPSYQKIFYDELPRAMNALLADPSPAAQARASVTYNLIVEGVMAETGYHGYFQALERKGVLPGLRQGLRLIQQDESRHLAYGIFLISRLVAEHGVWPAVEQRMNELVEAAVSIVVETFGAYETVPFDLRTEDFVEFASSQFSRRSDRIELARTQSLEQIYRAVDLEE